VFYLDNKIGRFLVADKFGRCLYDRRQIIVGRFYSQTKLANFIVRLTSASDNSSICTRLMAFAHMQ